MTSGIALTSAIPAGPANLGTFEAAAVFIGDAIGIAREQALALALISHVTILIITSVGGGISLVRVGSRPSAQDQDLGEAKADPEPS